MKDFLVSYQNTEGRWINVGRFKARNTNGALAQFARGLRHFPAVIAIRAEEV